MRYLFLLCGLIVSCQVLACESAESDLSMPDMQEFRTLNNFIMTSSEGIEDESMVQVLNISKNHLNLSRLYDQFKPFATGYPVKNLKVANQLNKLEEEMCSFAKTFYAIFQGVSVHRVPDHKIPGAFLPNSFTSQSDMDQTYTVIKPAFLVFQKLSNKFMDIMSYYYDNYKQLPKLCGFLPVKSDPRIGYLMDSSEGYLLFPADDNINTIGYRLIPYGEPRIGRSRIILHANKGKIFENTGLMILVNDDIINKFQCTIYCGAHTETPFFEAPHPLYFPLLAMTHTDIAAELLGHDVLTSLRVKLFKMLNSVVEIKDDLEPNQVLAYLPFPETPAEQDLAELLYIEDLIQTRNDPAHPDHLLAIEHLQIIEKAIAMPIEQYVDDLNKSLLQQIEDEQNKRHELLIAGEIPGKVKKPKGKKGGKGKSAKAVESAATVAKPTKALAKAFAQYKLEGQVKWAHIIKMINTLTNNYPVLRESRITMRGSHITFHRDDVISTSIAVRHGSQDLTLPASRVNNFVMNLLATVFN